MKSKKYFFYNLKKLPFLIGIGSFLLLANACTKSPERAPIARSYYYWKTNFLLSQKEQLNLLDTLKITTLYLRFFDVHYDEKLATAMPVGNLTVTTKIPEQLKIVPVVYITNETLQRIKSTVCDSLAARISQKIHSKIAANGLSQQVKEWQLDCDWSAKTRQKYFAILLKIKALNPSIRLSATIRLHQLKYPEQTGVPPVQRGMLMLYNMSDVAKAETKNSILDIAVTRRYINEKTRYKLPLDLAFPAFAWGALFRGAHFEGLLNNWNEATCSKQSFLQHTTANNWVCTQDTVVGARYWRRGDRLRLEGGDAKSASQLYDLCKNITAKDTVHIAYFHWNGTSGAKFDF